MPAAPSPFDQKCNAACLQARQLAEALERGSADRPLSEHFTLLSAFGEVPLAVTLLALTPQAAQRSLRWLSGGGFFGVSLSALQKAALAIIEIDGHPGHSTGVGNDSVLVHIDGSGSAPVRQISLRFPLVIARVADDGVLFRKAVAGSNLLLVAAEASAAITSGTQQTVRDFASAIGFAVPLVFQDPVPEGETAPAASGWWLTAGLLGSATGLQPIGVSIDSPPSPGELIGPGSPIRHYLGAARRIETFRLATTLVRQQYELRLRRLRARLKQEARDIRRLDTVARDPERRNRLDAIRADLADGFAKLLDGLEEGVKRSLLPDSALQQQLEKAADGVSLEDLDFEKTALSIQVMVGQQFQDKVADLIRDLLREDFSRDARTIRKGLQDLQSRTEEQLQKVMGAPTPLTLRPPDPAPAWNHLRQMIKVEIRYKGDMPKRGMFKRIMEARSAVMMLTMLTTLTGGVMGLSARQLPIFGGILFLVFLGALAYTFRSWKQEDAVRIDKELDRVREGLKMELRRLVQDLEREKISRFAAHVDDLKREVSRRLDSLTKDLADAQGRDVERDRREGAGRIKALETTIREVESLRGAFGGLDKLGAELEQAASAAPQKTTVLA